jgi:hypothetical protein
VRRDASKKLYGPEIAQVLFAGDKIVEVRAYLDSDMVKQLFDENPLCVTSETCAHSPRARWAVARIGERELSGAGAASEQA